MEGFNRDVFFQQSQTEWAAAQRHHNRSLRLVYQHCQLVARGMVQFWNVNKLGDTSLEGELTVRFSYVTNMRTDVPSDREDRYRGVEIHLTTGEHYRIYMLKEARHDQVCQAAMHGDAKIGPLRPETLNPHDVKSDVPPEHMFDAYNDAFGKPAKAKTRHQPISDKGPVVSKELKEAVQHIQKLAAHIKDLDDNDKLDDDGPLDDVKAALAYVAMQQVD